MKNNKISILIGALLFIILFAPSCTKENEIISIDGYVSIERIYPNPCHQNDSSGIWLENLEISLGSNIEIHYQSNSGEKIAYPISSYPLADSLPSSIPDSLKTGLSHIWIIPSDMITGNVWLKGSNGTTKNNYLVTIH